MSALTVTELQASGFTDLSVEAAAHLMSPVDAQVGVQVQLDPSGLVHFRGETSNSKSLQSISELFQNTWLPGDLPLRPHADFKGSVVKIGRSGSGTLYWGLREVYGLENVYARSDVNERVALEVVHLLLDGLDPSKEGPVNGLNVSLVPGKYGVVIRSDLRVTHR